MPKGKASLEVELGVKGARQLADAEQRIDKLAGSLNRAFAGTDSVSVAMTRAQPQIEKVATAASGLSSALGGAGSKGGILLGAVSNIASAMSVGGPLLAGIAVVTTGVGILGSQWLEARKAAESATKEMSAGVETLGQRIQKATEDAERRIAKSAGVDFFEVETLRLKEQLEAREKELEEHEARTLLRFRNEQARRGVSIATADLPAAFAAETARLRSAVGALDDQYVEAMGSLRDYLEAQRVAAAVEGKRRAAIDANNEALERLKRTQSGGAAKKVGATEQPDGPSRKDRDRLISDDIERQDRSHKAWLATLDQQEREQNAMHERSVRRAEAEREKRIQAAISEFQRLSRLQQQFDDRKVDRQFTRARDELRQFAEVEKVKTAILRDEEARRLESQRESMAAWSSFREELLADAISVSTSLVNQGLDAWLTSVESVAAGQKIAFDEMASAFLMSTGRMIFGIGLKYAIEGAGMIAVSGGFSPQGWATAGVGAAGMAAGAAMATSGAIVSGFSASRAGGGGGGRSIGSVGAPRRDRSGSDAGGGEGIVINFSGGTFLGDPTERARTFARDQSRSRREVYVPGQQP